MVNTTIPDIEQLTTRIANADPSISIGEINVQGNVEGSIVVGNQNVIGNNNVIYRINTQYGTFINIKVKETGLLLSLAHYITRQGRPGYHSKY